MQDILAGRQILIVDDEFVVAMNIEALLAEAGARAMCASSCAQAMDLLGANEFDAALLDVHLEDGSSYAVADELQARGIPLAFLSGYLTVREGYSHIPFLGKPTQNEAVRDTLEALLRQEPLQPGPPA